eukprot:Phypoly_transcript_15792.p1 GENE.Phypoly_transcript_15792~~Phypoly_transcript_15792.p1  ORF type:complete len:226 (+),score=32.60 Phypoly_transcript_15792:161-838(+)
MTQENEQAEEFAKNVSTLVWDSDVADQQKILQRGDHFKIVVVGDGAVGKTCLLTTFLRKRFPTDYIPTLLDISFGKMKSGDCSISISLWDTASREDFSKLRILTYTGAHCALVCFSVVNATSLNNAKTKYVPDLKNIIPGVPIILVGLKTDLRSDTKTIQQLEKYGEKMVTYEEAEEAAKYMKVAKYMECSALQQKGLEELFATAVRYSANLIPTNKESKKCVLL